MIDWSSSSHRGRRTRRAGGASAVLLALAIAPAPLLPPHGLAEAVQRAGGVQWKTAYLLAVAGLTIGFYGSLGILASFAVRRPHTPRKRLLRIVVLPVVVIAATTVIRLLKLGHVPIWPNAVVPPGAGRQRRLFMTHLAHAPAVAVLALLPLLALTTGTTVHR